MPTLGLFYSLLFIDYDLYKVVRASVIESYKSYVLRFSGGKFDKLHFLIFLSLSLNLLQNVLV